MKRRHRRLSPTEWAYAAASPEFPPFAVQLLIEADETPSMTAMSAALERVAAANPGARLVRDGRWWTESDIAPLATPLPRESPLDIDHPLFRTAFADDSRPPLEVHCCANRGVVFRCSHALMDARGLLYFAEETFRALRGEPLLGTTTALSDHEYLRSRASSRSRPWPASRVASPLGSADDDSRGFSWERRRLRAEANALPAKLMHAIAELVAARVPEAPSRFLLPVDLRRTGANLRTTGNFSNALVLEFPSLDDWTEVHERIVMSLARHDELAIGRGEAWLSRVPGRLLRGTQRWVHDDGVRRDRYIFTAIVSHIGRISLAALTAPHCAPRAAYFLPFDAPGSALTLVVTQHDHGIEIAASAPNATASNGRLSRALDVLEHAVGGAARSARGATTQSARATVIDSFLACVGRVPDRIALRFQDCAWTYADFAAQVDAWAVRLRDAGVGGGDRVAIVSSRCASTIAALFGVMRAGATFVPIDPAWPRARTDLVLEDCAPRCIVNPALDRIESVAHAPGSVQDACAAYVMYTSGSTGRPKGVVVSHASLANYVEWTRTVYRGDDDAAPVYPLFTSLAFDLTLTALFVPLTSGGALHIVETRDPLLAARQIVADREIDSIKLTPSHLRLFAEVGLGQSGLRTFVVGGEDLPTQLAARVHSQLRGDARVFNEYGPTETTVGCIVHRYDPVTDRGPSVPIGRPIAGTTIALLDELGREVAPGNVGEIVISGDCVADGYLRRTADDARFENRSRIRSYRTGDLALRTPEGTLVYRGRNDDQVKVRGHRVELLEVERAIAKHGGVDRAAVMIEHTANSSQLVAYVVWRANPDEAALRHELAASLPDYMVPSRIIGVDDLPLSANGKIDRRALPGGRPSEPPHASSSATPPTMGCEAALREWLASELRRPVAQIAVDVPVHDLGCDSLQIALLVEAAASRVSSAADRAQFYEALPSFFRHPTIRELANRTLPSGR